MERIHPICEEKILPLKGQKVCAVLHDETMVYGTIEDVRDGKIFISPGYGEADILSNKKKKKSKKSSAKNRKATISAFGYPGYGAYGGFGAGAAFAISLGLIALLFAGPAFGYPFFF